ncbi:MAG: succinate dehydrogenase, hydrophobic membrane anchor protein [Gammaproteobacteria bacterium]|nr:succinate dehydrogenase, hydrophobic membrane anchor protein [Gammaproteobacteria bacterium]
MSWRAGGIRPWIVQRMSAVFMVLAIVLFALKILGGNTDSFELWYIWMSDPVWNVIVIMFWLFLMAHAWVGIRDVVMDYVHPDAIRFSVLAILAFYLMAMTVWMLRIFIMAGNS